MTELPLTLTPPSRRPSAAPTCGSSPGDEGGCGAEDAVHYRQDPHGPLEIRCCACWVKSGRLPTDHHAGCRKAAGLPEPDKWNR